MKQLLILSFLIFCITYINAQDISIIPQPARVEKVTGNFKLSPATRIVYEKDNQDLKALGKRLSNRIKDLTGWSLKVAEVAASSSRNEIRLAIAETDSLGNEGYAISAGPKGISITASKPAGIFYASETIYQLLPPGENQLKASASILIPALEIVDKPRFPWRGLMLDVGRYFYSVEFIKEFIDYLAMHKMNTFHWHLTEDHGWRIEIKKYPLLTEIGAWREGTQFTRFHEHINRNPHGGYYTQEEIREVVKYAQDRFVNVVPEVEMPGHTLAVLVAYPELSCTGGPFRIPEHWDLQDEIFCAGNEKTFAFLEDVLTEVTDLFPSPVIHIGGDEARKTRWKACPKCQKRMRDENLKDEHELQSYFIKRIENFLRTRNRKILGWDEILEGGLAPNAMVMSWRGEAGGIAAAKMHHNVIMAPNHYAYLDYYQGEPYLEPPAIGGLVTLEKTYSYEPVAEQLSPEEAKYIQGVQGNVWAEYIHSPEKVQYMAFPRAAAVAETGWSLKENKNWESFKKRIEKQYQRYERMGINYAKSAYNVWIESSVDTSRGKAVITLKTQSFEPEIRYTVDGSEPNAHSSLYTNPFELPVPVTVKAANFRNSQRISKVSERSVFVPLIK